VIIVVRSFAIFREILGSKILSIKIENNSSVEDVLLHLQELYPATSSIINVSMFAVNQKYVEKTHILKNEDELALIPPVSGGK
jgi:molybdopterin converting factor subunit 1